MEIGINWQTMLLRVMERWQLLYFKLFEYGHVIDHKKAI
jgi:hypothetical protein